MVAVMITKQITTHFISPIPSIIRHFTLLFSHLTYAFIQSNLQIRKSNWNYKLKVYKYYMYTFKKMEKLNKMTNAYNNISKVNI